MTYTTVRKSIKFLGRPAFIGLRGPNGRVRAGASVDLNQPGKTYDPFNQANVRDSYAIRDQRIVTSIKKSTHKAAPRRTRQRGASSRSTAKSGDSNSSSDDPEPERNQANQAQLYDQSALADLLKISKKTLQNLYSRTPHLLPPTIQIPGARGPRWTPQSVQEWLEQRPTHTTKTVPVAPARKVGRPRIAAVAGKGGVSC